MNGDDFGDVIIGADNYSNVETNEGAAFLYMGILADAGADTDGDGIPNENDNCPNDVNTNQLNTDGDKQGDACDPDDDNDTVLDVNDNCPLNANNG